jgi:xanthine dehydrogenase YagR molybdenum-binding subunit
MEPFEFRRAANPEEAMAIAGAPGAAFLAGGTELVAWLAEGIATPSLVVDIGGIGIDGVARDDRTILIGGGARLADVAGHPVVREHLALLVDAIEAAASPAIRSRGTIAGNLLQRTRCPYFRSRGPCNKLVPGTGCGAREGDHRSAAIFGGNDRCIAVHPSDVAVALAALDATLVIAGPGGRRESPIAELYQDAEPTRDFTLEPAELVLGLAIPIPEPGWRSAYLKVRDRASFDFALISAAVACRTDGGVVSDVRLVLGGVAHRPWRCRVAEAAMIGRPLDRVTALEAIAAELDRATVLPGNRFKLDLCRRTVAAIVDRIAGIHPEPPPFSSRNRVAGARPPAPPATARPDALPKVTGAGRYLADLEFADLVDGVFVTSRVGAGRLLSLDTEAAARVPGVIRILRQGDLPGIGAVEHWAAGQATLPLMTDEIRHHGQPIALVLAESRRAAVESADRVTATYSTAPVDSDFERGLERAEEIEDWAPTRTSVGSVDAGLGEAEVIISGRYRTADRHHAAMEPSAVVARWDNDELDVWTSTQWVFGVRAGLAQALGVSPEKVRVRSALVGGGFGAKGSLWPHEILAAAAARIVGRAVRIVLPRNQTFTAHGHQPATIHELTLGARRDGGLTAIRHHCWSAAALADDYIEHGALGTRKLYACDNLETREAIVRLNRPQPTFMRAPHEGPGLVGLEIAMDELAHNLGLDPVQLRLRNHSDRDPTSGKPFSTKALRACYRLGAERFGWDRRSRVPGITAEGNTLIGSGMASAQMSTFRFGASARVTLRRDGSVLVESGTHEIGSGVTAMLATVASEALGVPVERVRVVLGDTRLPEAGGTFGSATTLSVGSAAHQAATQLKQRIEALAAEPGLEPREYPEVLALHRLEQVVETATWAPKSEENAYAMNAYGAVFVEVRLDRRIPVPRVTRCVGVYSVGRIINPTTARSQAIGGILWGIGQALLEESRIDGPSGRFVPQGFGGYHVPGNADSPPVEVEFAEEYDPQASLLGARGVGEIGTIGVGAAVANAVFNATGVRVRQLPIRIEHLL